MRKIQVGAVREIRQAIGRVVSVGRVSRAVYLQFSAVAGGVVVVADAVIKRIREAADAIAIIVANVDRSVFVLSAR